MSMMKAKRDLLCKTICRKDLTRLWPLWSLEMLFLLFSVVIPIGSGLRAYKINCLGREFSILNDYNPLACFMSPRQMTYSPDWEVKRLLEEYGVILNHPFLIAPLCLVVTLFLFSYLYKARSAYSVHALPFKREQIFLSHYAAGLVILVVPFGITYGILAGIAKGCGAARGMELLIELIITLIEILLFYHLACCILMLTANGVMTTFLYVVANVIYQGVAMVFFTMASFCIYGYQGGDALYTGLAGRYLTPVVFFLGEDSLEEVLNRYFVERYYYARLEDTLSKRPEDWQLWYGPDLEQTLWYLIPIVLLLGLALVLYKKRPMEHVGNMMAFSWGKPIFRVLFTVCGSLLFSLIGYGIYLNWDWYSISYGDIFRTFLLLIVLGSIVCYLVSNMILAKSFFIWKKTSYWRMVLLTMAMAGIFCYMKYGYGAGIPSVDKVVLAEIKIPDTGIFEKNNYYITGKEQVKTLQKLHKKILEYGETCPREELEDSSWIRILYRQKNHQTIKRYYMVPGLALRKMGTGEFLSEQEGICERVFSPAYQEAECTLAKVIDQDNNLICEESYGDATGQEEIEKMYDAILLDLQQGNIVVGDYKKYAPFYVKITCCFSREVFQKYQISEGFFEGNTENDFEEDRETGKKEDTEEEYLEVCLPITKECENVNAVLEEWQVSQAYREVGETL